MLLNIGNGDFDFKKLIITARILKDAYCKNSTALPFLRIIFLVEALNFAIKTKFTLFVFGYLQTAFDQLRNLTHRTQLPNDSY